MRSKDTHDTRGARDLSWTVLLCVAVATLAFAGLILLLAQLGAPAVILGTAIVMLGFGARIGMVLGQFATVVETVVERSCWAIVALGVMCFEGMDVRIWTGAIALTVLLGIELLESRFNRR